MKNIFKRLCIIMSVASIFAACTKMDKLPFYKNGNAVTLTSDVTTITPNATDSSKTVLNLTWTSPNYATDSATQKFVVEMDSTGRNFSNAMSFVVEGPLGLSFTGAQLNNMLANFGFTPGTPFSVDIRVTSSFANNNEQYQSNVVTVTMTPYLVPITLAPSSTSPITLDVANGSSSAISFTWNASNYGNNEIDYAVQIDTAGGDFSNPQIFKYGTALNGSLIENDLNIAIINLGILGGSTKDIQFRVVSYLGASYTNPLVYSDPVIINVTTYVPVPDNLYIVGDATPGGWNNPVPVPSQQFTKADAYSFSIIVNLNSTGSYLFLPVNGSWDHKYGGASATGGTLLADGQVPGSNTPAPSTTGLYKITVNFQTNSYSVTPITVPANLFIVGDATTGGWNNPVPTPSQQFTQISTGVFGIITNLNAPPSSYLFLPVNGDWGHKYGGASATGGTLLADNDVPGSNTPAPATAGVYKIVVNFATNTYTVTPYTGVPLPSNLYIVGDATAGGWNNPVPVPSQQFTQLSNAEFKITMPLNGGKSYLFLPVNGDWTHKYGGTSATNGTILYDNDVPGSNTPAPSSDGTYTIDVNFVSGTYSVQ